MGGKLNQLSLIAALLLSGLNLAIGQSCSILSNDYACVDEPISFVITASSSIDKVSWDFDNGSTASQLQPLSVYSNPGTYTVVCKVELKDGTSCKAEKNIQIHGLPTADFRIDSSSVFCFQKNNLCLINRSSGFGNNSIAEAIILWDDGAKTVINNPYKNQTACHKYKTDGDYTLEILIEDDKGCEAIQEIDQTIKEDVIMSLSSQVTEKTCDYWEVDIINDSSHLTPFIDSVIWDLGDGTIQKGDFKGITHRYEEVGTYTASITVYLKNGCSVNYTTSFFIDLPDVSYDYGITPYKQCRHTPFTLKDNVSDRGSYVWHVLDTGMNYLFNVKGQTATINPDVPGKYYVRGYTLEKGCEIYSNLDSFESLGLQIKFLRLNGNQCNSNDTVYFTNTSKIHGTDSINWLWDFNDSYAVYDTNQNGVFGNFQYSKNRDAKHFYSEPGCYRVFLKAQDMVNGCRETAALSVGKFNNNSINFFFENDRSCINPEGREKYRFTFGHDKCNVPFLANFDSACGPSNWEYIRKDQWNHFYYDVCSPDKKVTVGFVPLFGDTVRYLSNDTNDFVVDYGLNCADTIWKHNWFTLQDEPEADGLFEGEGCLPVSSRFEPSLRTQPNVDLIYAKWGDDSKDSMTFAPGTAIPTMQHVYREEGEYTPRFYVETDSGCFDLYDTSIIYGFYNDVIIDSILCKGQELVLYDTIKYFDDDYAYWNDSTRKALGKETLKWNFHDGLGFSSSKNRPTQLLSDTGEFKVTLVSKDENDCYDTLTKAFEVSSIYAGMKQFSDEIICDGITQLFDSSYSPFSSAGDTLSYFWDFGDSKTPSFLINPYHYYENPGTFQVKHSITNSRGCSDTTFQEVTIGGPTAHFNLLSDSIGCVEFEASFKNNSNGCAEYIWYFGDQLGNTYSTQSEEDVRFIYENPGEYSIYLLGSDSIFNPVTGRLEYCSSYYPDSLNSLHQPVTVEVVPLPKANMFADTVICLGNSLTLQADSNTFYTDHLWIIGNDTIQSQNPSATYTPESAGSLGVSYRPTYDPMTYHGLSCFDSDSVTVTVQDFQAQIISERESNCSPFELQITPHENLEIDWLLNTQPANLKTENHIALVDPQDTGSFVVCAEVTDTLLNCADQLCDTVSNDYYFSLFVPNIITPNDDGLNDYFDVEIRGESYYHLSVFNRWGTLLYESRIDGEDHTDNFTGFSSDGLLLPEGTYFYLFSYKDECSSEIQEMSGSLTIVH
jgi:gliding motility-associated-like protein